MKFLARKEFGHLTPVDSGGEDALRKIKFGSTVQITVKQPRNVQHHRKYFALLNMVFENQERYATRDELHAALKVSAGIYTPVTLPSGTEVRIPGSIAFHEMDQTEFSEFYDKCCELISKHFLPGVPSETIKAEVQNMIGTAA